MSASLCPLCGEPVQRIRRRPIDRLLSLFFPVRRYRCVQFRCGWEGTLRVRKQSRQRTDLRFWKR
jgi:hypothetical protein